MARRCLDDYERSAITKSWNQATMAKYFLLYLTGAAQDWFAILVHTDTTRGVSWPEIRDSFCCFYIGKDVDLALERALKDSILGDNDSCSNFTARYARVLMLSDLYASPSKMMNVIRICLRPEFIERLSSHRLLDLEDLNLACSNIENGLRASSAADRLRKNLVSSHDLKKKGDIPAKAKAHQPKSDGQPKNEQSSCFRCGRKGHIKSECFALKRKKGSELKDQVPRKPTLPLRRANVNAVAENDNIEEKPSILITKKCMVLV